MTKNEKTSELIEQAVETLKVHTPPTTFKEPAAITAYYAIFNTPPVWKPGIRIPQEVDAPAAKKPARFKRSF